MSEESKQRMIGLARLITPGTLIFIATSIYGAGEKLAHIEAKVDRIDTVEAIAMGTYTEQAKRGPRIEALEKFVAEYRSQHTR